ncbi:hypothetical protein YG5714_0955 [Sulfolobus islandicus Y.G.57.14]|uniref:MFS transporter n=2 Tax=Saccharolobus TaxID=2100760 RepID=C3NCZ8_SACI7|nr:MULTISPECIES: hypothetical protein [Sulfolobaceae]ACP45226.1 hypothetical protein YG5714_0955 [Sulfolobus islandicus Y.G.57.14]QPG49325.1 MHS family MFS transporter [Saccharolobus solfataricus]
MVSMKNKVIIASSFGMALEWYDFFTYSYVATIIAPLSLDPKFILQK